MLTLNDGRNELWQWDTGRKLTVDADCTQVHFSNKLLGRSIDVDVIDGVANIPDVILQTEKDFTAWAFVGTPKNGYTKISKVFKVNKRNKPADYVFTPPEQTSLEEIKEKLDYLESIQDPDAIKNAVENYLEQNPAESPVQSVNGKIGKVELTAEDVGAISQDDLQEATNEALAQAKESGDFDGDDYVLTDDDKTEIAELAAGLVKVPEAPEISMQPLTFTGAVRATYDGSSPVSVEIPSGGGGTGLEVLKDITLEESVMEFSDTLDKGYNKLVIYLIAPKADGNTTNNNKLWCVVNGLGGWRFDVGAVSLYGPIAQKTEVDRVENNLFVIKASGAGGSNSSETKIGYDGGAISTFRIYPNTSGESDMIPAGTRLIIQGRVDI